MRDRRLTPSNGRVAHVSLRGEVEAESYVDGELHRIARPVADILSAPGGGRDRQLMYGEVFRVLDVQGGLAFGFAEKDGYCGWMNAGDLTNTLTDAQTHRITASHSYGKTTPGLKAMGQITPLSLGTRLTVLKEVDGWARVAWSRGATPQDLYVPGQHLVPIDTLDSDPVAVAERLVGAPYLWGGDSSFGIDCSGLVQIALYSCGQTCPRDSDMQEALGTALPPGTPPERGDLMFWKGHVAWVADPDTILHANAHAMAVAYEPITQAVARIESQGDGLVIRHARLSSSG
ncbi:C40 family peptidase [Antarctobacter heliothermus]|uniref:Cell wall-associated hydrolase, NlpC family n=1 Tax=Antarctobacter heliothermus TaxID=74033 RepID=A0A239CHA4_9RHOB|nr:NlpC/P60 family protein [Antarctobacter heliothermus]SNS18723.1 Cell wall-associated hydrolase, NlpC family [Antarctobacter heliothermus]